MRLDLGGVLAVLSDTAGVRAAPGDAIEAAGMARSADAWRTAAVRCVCVCVCVCVCARARAPSGVGQARL